MLTISLFSLPMFWHRVEICMKKRYQCFPQVPHITNIGIMMEIELEFLLLASLTCHCIHLFQNRAFVLEICSNAFKAVVSLSDCVYKYVRIVKRYLRENFDCLRRKVLAVLPFCWQFLVLDSHSSRVSQKVNRISIIIDTSFLAQKFLTYSKLLYSLSSWYWLKLNGLDM